MRRKKINKQSCFNFIDPGVIMGTIIALIILAVGVFAFFVSIGEINSAIENTTTDSSVQNTSQNISSTGYQLFNIVGIVLIIGAIMAVVGLVYNFVGRPSPSYKPYKQKVKKLFEDKQKTIERKKDKSSIMKRNDAERLVKEDIKIQKALDKYQNTKEKPKKKKEGWQI